MDAVAQASLQPLAQVAPSAALALPADASLAWHALPGAAAREDRQQSRQGFTAGGLRLMVRYGDGHELADPPATTALPNAPRWFVGMANLHGLLVPVFDLARHVGLQTAPPARPMLLVLGHGGDLAGVLIDGLPQRLRWTPEQVAAPQTVPPTLAPLVHCAVAVGDELWFDLDVAALLDSFERALRP